MPQSWTKSVSRFVTCWLQELALLAFEIHGGLHNFRRAFIDDIIEGIEGNDLGFRVWGKLCTSRMFGVARCGGFRCRHPCTRTPEYGTERRALLQEDPADQPRTTVSGYFQKPQTLNP